MLYTRNCAHCGKAFETANERAIYCSNSHRVAEQRKRNREQKGSVELGDTPEPEMNPIPPAQAPVQKPSAQAPLTKPAMQMPSPTAGYEMQVKFIFDQQNKEMERWEKLYNEEREKVKKNADKIAELEKQLRDKEEEKRLEAAARPSTLNGIMENPVTQTLIQQFGPVLAGWLDQKIKDPGMGGVNQQAEWISNQPEEIQNALRELINEIAKETDNSKVLATFIQLKNIVEQKAPFQPQAQQQARARSFAI